MLDPEEITEELEILANHRRRLQYLRYQLEQFGEKHAPPHIVADLRQAREDISRIKAILVEAGVPVEDQPDDNAPAFEHEALALLDRAQQSLVNPYLYHFLKWKYRDEEVLERCGEIYPVAIFRAQKKQRTMPNSVLLDLEERQPDEQELNPRDARYRALLRLRAGSRLFDGDTFAMKQLDVTDGHLGVRCQLGSYYRCLDTCDSLEWEILDQGHWLQYGDERSFVAFDQQLSLRSQLHAKVANPIRDGAFRSAAIAISTLIVYKEQGQTYLWVKKRSQAGVAVHRELFHVLPSFMFAPTTDNTQKEYSITHNIYREYLEEIFNRCEPEEGQRDWNYLYGDPCYQYLDKLIKAGKAGLYFSGVAVNLFNLRPEICTVLIIDTDEWYQRHSTGIVRGKQRPDEAFWFNLEWEDRRSEIKRGLPTIARIPYHPTDEAMMQASGDRLRPMHMVPPGAAAFWLGIDVLREILDSKEQPG